MQRNLNLRQIEIFKAFMECHTTTAASERLNISQPTISEHLSTLEHQTGLKLFERRRNRLKPTPIAEAFYSEVARVYHGVEHLERFVDGLENKFTGQIDFGTLPMASYRWVPDVLAQFLKSHQVGSISMPVRSSRQILEWVAADRLDFGIVLAAHDYPQVRIEELLRIPIVCLFPKETGLESKQEISWSDLEGQTLVRLRTFDNWTVGMERAFQSQARPKNVVETYVTQTAAQIAVACRGCALVDLMSALECDDDTVAWRPFVSDESFVIHLAYSSSRFRAPEAEALMDFVRLDASRQAEMIRKAMAEERTV